MAPEWQLEVVPITGSVLVNGQPATDVFVNFHSMDGETSKATIVPRAQSDHEGNFTVSTYATGDGAPVGTYRLSFSWVGPLGDMKEEEYERLPEKLNRKFLNAKTSGIEVTVTESTSVLDPFLLN